MTIKALQSRLLGLGFNPGAVDGAWGPKTEAAINAALDYIRPRPIPSDTAAAQLVAQQPFAARSINEVVIHCTATPEGRDVSVETVRTWHKAKGWRDIGYHYVVLLNGAIEPGRPEAEIGAHTLGRNEGTLGVVYVGGVDADGKAKDTRTEAQKAGLTAITRALCVKYPKIAKVTGHNEYAVKDCPSFNVRTDPLAKIPNEW